MAEVAIDESKLINSSQIKSISISSNHIMNLSVLNQKSWSKHIHKVLINMSKVIKVRIVKTWPWNYTWNESCLKVSKSWVINNQSWVLSYFSKVVVSFLRSHILKHWIFTSQIWLCNSKSVLNQIHIVKFAAQNVNAAIIRKHKCFAVWKFRFNDIKCCKFKFKDDFLNVLIWDHSI